MNLGIYELIDRDLNITSSPDPEIKQRWLPLGITLNSTTAEPTAHTWICSMGRSKYLTPVYRSLELNGEHDTGVEWLCENIDFYHPVAITSLKKELHLSSDF